MVKTSCISCEYHNSVKSDQCNFEYSNFEYNINNHSYNYVCTAAAITACYRSLGHMGENDFNRTRRSRCQVSTASTTKVATKSTSPKSTSSSLVQIVPPPPLTVIDLTVESIEVLMMADVQEQKAASDNKTSEQQAKSTRGNVNM